MADDVPNRQAVYDARRDALEEAVAALPPVAREFVRDWRSAVELRGRGGPGGCGLLLLERFVADVSLLVAPPPPRGGKAAGEHATGSGS